MGTEGVGCFQASMSAYRTGGAHYFVHLEQSIAKTLMVALSVIMLNVFVYRATQRCLPNEDHAIP